VILVESLPESLVFQFQVHTITRVSVSQEMDDADTGLEVGI